VKLDPSLVRVVVPRPFEVRNAMRLRQSKDVYHLGFGKDCMNERIAFFMLTPARKHLILNRVRTSRGIPQMMSAQVLDGVRLVSLFMRILS
jgi:hypothetical protein